MRSTLIRRLATPVSSSSATNIAQSTPKTQSRASSRPRPTRREPPLSLEHFLLRSRVLGLYRTIARAIYQIPDKQTRKEPMAHAKGEFARNKNVKETEQIRYLVSTGKAEWDGMRRYVEEMGQRAGK